MSSETIDPLDLLKEFMVSQYGPNPTDSRRITLTDGFLVFESPERGVLRLPLDSDTAWKSKQAASFYSLGALYFCILHKGARVGDYMKKCQEAGVKSIPITEKAEILSYFTGAKPQSDMIDLQRRTQTLVSKNELRLKASKHSSQAQAAGQLTKKREIKLNEKMLQKIEQEKQMSVNDFLLERELKLSNRNTVLQS